MAILAFATLITWLMAIALAVSALRGRGLLRTLRRLITAAAFAGLGLLLGSLLTFLHAFHAFSGETLAARVTTSRLGPDEFALTYAPADARDGAARTMRLRGDQWAISGGVVKWHPWLTALGLKSYHKPMRLSGQFARLERQRASPPTVYALDATLDRFWEGLYWTARYLPIVEAVYGSSAYVYVEPGSVQEVYVTPSGYMIKRTYPSP